MLHYVLAQNVVAATVPRAPTVKQAANRRYNLRSVPSRRDLLWCGLRAPFDGSDAKRLVSVPAADPARFCEAACEAGP
ncbi:MAG TPA: hypothetical protein VK630_19765 [Reyranella sp.]|nr:hypothetical protein [Reyranella sp.]